MLRPGFCVAPTGRDELLVPEPSNLHTVSVVVIFWNAEKFIDEAIESVLAQTYRDWELLLLNDGSTDSSPSIALRYAAMHASQVRYLEHPNRGHFGIAASRNLGMQSSSGEFVA